MSMPVILQPPPHDDLIEDLQSHCRSYSHFDRLHGLEDYKSGISALQAQIKALEDYISCVESFFAPVRHVPNEVLALISLQDPHLDPPVLSAVCCHWRRVCHDTPWLWTRLRLTGQSDIPDLNSIISRLRRAWPHKIELILGVKDVPFSANPRAQQFLSAMPWLGSPIAMLELNISASHYEALNSLSPCSFPFLERLVLRMQQLQGLYLRGFHGSRRLWRVGIAQTAEHFTEGNTEHCSVDLEHVPVTYLQLGVSNIAVCFQIIQQCADTVRKLGLKLTIAPTISVEPILLPQLRRLTMCAREQPFDFLVRRLSCPKLNILTSYFNGMTVNDLQEIELADLQESQRFPSLATFLTGSPDIQVLRVYGFAFGFLNALSVHHLLLQNVETLKLGRTWADRRFLNDLVFSKVSGTLPLCPRLRKLWVYVSLHRDDDFQICDCLLADLISQRQGIEGTGVSRLEECYYEIYSWSKTKVEVKLHPVARDRLQPYRNTVICRGKLFR